MDQLGKVANPARGQLNRKSVYSLSPFASGNLVSRDRFGRPVPRLYNNPNLTGTGFVGKCMRGTRYHLGIIIDVSQQNSFEDIIGDLHHDNK